MKALHNEHEKPRGDRLEKIQQKAKSGEPGRRGLSEEDMASILDEIAIAPSTTQDTKGSKEKTKIDTEVMIGEGRDVRFPLLLSHPLFVDSSEMGKVNKHVKISLTYGASIAKTPINIGEGLLADETKIANKFKGNYILSWSPIRIGIDRNSLGKVKAVVIDMSGAYLSRWYPTNQLLDRVQGKGGLASAYVLGPKRHLDIETKDDLKNHVGMLREATGYKIPIMVKISTGAVYERTKSALEANADAVIVDTSMDPFSTPSCITGTFGAMLIGSIPPAVKAFKAMNAQKKGVKLLVSGGFRNGNDVVKAMAMGVDAVGIVESAAVALGCNLCGKCYTGECEKGIATKDSDLKAKFKWKIAGKRLANHLKATRKEIEMIMDVAGVASVKDLSSKHIVALTYETAAITGIRLTGYDRELPMWFH